VLEGGRFPINISSKQSVLSGYVVQGVRLPGQAARKQRRVVGCGRIRGNVTNHIDANRHNGSSLKRVVRNGALLVATMGIMLACSAGEEGETPTGETPVVLSPEGEAEFTRQINLARDMLANGQTQEAMAPLERSKELKPDAFVVHNNYCVAYGNLQLRDEAVKSCERALQIEPEDQLAKNNLAWVSSIQPAVVP
jgi:tetratricopeptide (TPR) repeat protein